MKLVEEIDFNDIDEYFKSDSDLARAIGVHRQTVYFWRKSNQVPQRKQIKVKAEINRRKERMNHKNFIEQKKDQDLKELTNTKRFFSPDQAREEKLRLRKHEILNCYDNFEIYALIRSAKAVEEEIYDEVLSNPEACNLLDCAFDEIAYLLASAEFDKLEREKQDEFDIEEESEWLGADRPSPYKIK